MYERTNGFNNRAFYSRSDRQRRTKDIVEYALRRENEGAEGDARVPQRKEGPVDSCNQSRESGNKNIERRRTSDAYVRFQPPPRGCVSSPNHDADGRDPAVNNKDRE